MSRRESSNAEDTVTNLADAKQVVRAYNAALEEADPSEIAAVLSTHLAPDTLWRGLHPFHEQTGPEAIANTFWSPLRRAITSMQRREDIFFAGLNEIDGEASTWVASMGHLMGLFDEPWLGIRPTRRIVMLRYAEFSRVEGGKIVEQAMFFDVLHLMAQAGQYPLPEMTGAALVQPGPRTHDGLLLTDQNSAESAKTLARINAMIDAISAANEPDNVLTPQQELRADWHEDMLWWGPAGIGATYTIDRYIDQHQGPFRRHLSGRTFNGHLCRMAEGMYGGFFGWPNLTLTSRGGYMGLTASDRPGDMRVVDIYRREGDKLAENWIFIDIPHFLNQQGLDVLGRHSEMTGLPVFPEAS